MNDQKWRSPTGHPIASHETDQLTKTDINVTCGDVSNVGDIQAALDWCNRVRLFAVSLLEEGCFTEPLDTIERTLKRALAQQQPNTELLEAIKEVLDKCRHMNMLSRDNLLIACQIDQICYKAIARAEQKGGE